MGDSAQHSGAVDFVAFRSMINRNLFGDSEFFVASTSTQRGIQHDKLLSAQQALILMKREIAMYRNRLAHLMRVPLEILQYIFALVMRSSPPKYSLTLASICTHFRAVALATASLWTTLPVNKNLALTRAYLRHGGVASPIHLDLSLGLQWNRPEYLPVLECILHEFMRFQVIRIRVNGTGEAWDAIDAHFRDTPLPVARILSISFGSWITRERTEEAAVTLSSSKMPILTSLKLSDCHLRSPSIRLVPMNNLVHLELLHMNGWNTVMDLVSILRSTRRLEKLRFSQPTSGKPNPPLPPLAIDPIHLWQLADLEVSGFILEVLMLVTHIEITAKCNISLTTDYGVHCDEMMRPYIERFGDNLRNRLETDAMESFDTLLYSVHCPSGLECFAFNRVVEPTSLPAVFSFTSARLLSEDTRVGVARQLLKSSAFSNTPDVELSSAAFEAEKDIYGHFTRIRTGRFRGVQRDLEGAEHDCNDAYIRARHCCEGSPCTCWYDRILSNLPHLELLVLYALYLEEPDETDHDDPLSYGRSTREPQPLPYHPLDRTPSPRSERTDADTEPYGSDGILPECATGSLSSFDYNTDMRQDHFWACVTKAMMGNSRLQLEISNCTISERRVKRLMHAVGRDRIDWDGQKERIVH
ncbi:hypothetical protein PENSPDRAFT_691417 [Peniophora sp. CONT]|nr:hypothetical protein PENSPDRAFT_691417 [Peniophora sp. CONT]